MTFIRHINGSFHRSVSEQVSHLPFRNGQILYGKIESIQPNQTALVQVGGETLIAQLQVPLQVGSHYWFQVSISDETFYLKLVEQLNTEMENSQQTADEAAQQLARQWELPRNAQPLLRFLLQEQLPIVKEDVFQAAKWLSETKDTEAGLQAIRYMYTHRLPFTKEIFLAMKAAQHPLPLSKQLLDLQNALMSLPPQQQTETVQSLLHQLQPLTTGEVNVYQTISLLLEKWAHHEPQAQGLLQKLGLSLDENQIEREPERWRLRDEIKTGNEEAVKQQIGTLLARFQEQEPQIIKQFYSLYTAYMNEKLPESEQQFLKTIFAASANDMSSSAIAKTIKQFVQLLGLQYEADVQNAIKAKTIQMFEFVALKPLLLKAAQEVSEPSLKNMIETLTHRITGQQLLAQMQGPIQHLFIQIPFRFGNGLTDVTVHWQGKKQKNGQIDPNYCRILFYLQLERLKETVIDVNIQNRIVHISLINETPHLETLVAAMQPTLKERIEAYGYRLSTIKVVSSKQEKIAAPPLLQEQYSGVDYRI
ncbi:hypothetical protein [Thermaerobacillus caldiproteolyticus]|uniref:hypothetical protein n=1 Tax=Thermaerobacillus caldiproteolyticus TaxID=247480 RepID=UPI0018F15B84|nr:hypothetical protein [Anoxybacillus caldiproteolyticus]